MEWVQTLTNYEDDVVIERTFTGRFVQECATARCLPNECRWVCPEMTRVTVTTVEGGSPTTATTTFSNVAMQLGQRNAAAPHLWIIDNVGPFFAGDCPADAAAVVYAETNTYQPDGTTVKVNTTNTLTLTESEPLEGDPVCYCVEEAPMMMAARAAPSGYQPAEPDSDVVICENKIERDWTEEGQALLRAGITMTQGTKVVITAAAWNEALAHLRA